MKRIHRIASGLVLLQALALACLLAPGTPARPYEDDSVAFTIPRGWKTSAEVWEQTEVPGREYKGLGVQEIVDIMYPPYQGRARVFFTLASAPLAAGEDLESRFTRAYQAIESEMQEASQQQIEQGGLPGYEMTYWRAWGIPLWSFRDIWLEKDGMIYVLSFQGSLSTFDAYAQDINEILGSFRIKD